VTANVGVGGTLSSGGTYLFVDGPLATGSDKAVGFLTSSSVSSPRAIMFQYTNDSGSSLDSFTASWDYEKYRNGTRQFDWKFYVSADGTNWTAVMGGDQTYSSDASNGTQSTAPSTITKSDISLTLASPLASGASLYLRWSYVGLAGSSNAQALALDNFSLSATAVPAPGALALLGAAGLVGGSRRRR
jgi:hypothetical protein